MTDTTALRDELARSRGYGKSTSTVWLGPDGTAGPHPFKDGDLNALAAVWPEGWVLNIEIGRDGRARGRAYGPGGRVRESGGWMDSEYDVRLPLTVAAVGMAEKEPDNA